MTHRHGSRVSRSDGLPRRIDFDDGSHIDYAYSADGEKLTGTLLASPRILFRTEKRPVRVLIDGREVPFAQIDGCYEIPCGAAGAVQVTVNFS